MIFFISSMTREDKRGNTSKTRKTVSYDIQTTKGDISNMRRSVLSDIQTSRSNISNMRRSVLSDIQTSRSNISNMRRSVLSDIQTLRSNISNTRKSVLSDMQRPKGHNNTRESVFYLTPNTKMSYVCQTRLEGVFILYSKNKSLDWKRARRKEYFKLISWSQDVR